MRERDSPISTPAVNPAELSALNGTSRPGSLNSGAAAALARHTELERNRPGARRLGLRR